MALGGREARLERLELGRGLVLEIRVRKQLLVAPDVTNDLAVGRIGGLELLEEGVVAQRRAVALRVGQNSRVAQVRLNGRQTTQDVLDLPGIYQDYFANFA